MLSRESVKKILYLQAHSKYKFKSETIEKVQWLKSIDKFLEKEFKSEEFRTMLDTIINKMKKRDSKNYSQIIELAKSCKALENNPRYGMAKSLYYSAYDVFLDSDFYELCNVGIEKCCDLNIRMMAFELRDLSKHFRKRLNIK